MSQDRSFNAPIQSPFEAALQAAIKVSKSNLRGWDALRAVAAQMEALARDVSAEEIDKNRYASRLQDFAHGGLKAEIEEIFLIWMESGALLSDPEALAANLPLRLALDHPARLMGVLPGNPAWALATCGPTYAGDNDNGAAGRVSAMLSCSSREQEEQDFAFRRGMFNERWFGESDEQVRLRYQRHRDAVELFVRSDAMGRLQTLKENGREEAWLLHCLGFGESETIQRALDAGFRLDNTSQEAALAFARLNSRGNRFKSKARRFLSDCHRSLPSDLKKDEKSGYEASVAMDLQTAWDRWAMAVQAGLPKIECALESRRELEVDDGTDTIGPEAFAVLIQEVARDGAMTVANRRLWAKAAAAAEWPALFAQKAGAKPGETAMGWALRTGAMKASHWEMQEFINAMTFVHNPSNIGGVLKALGENGAQMDDPVEDDSIGLNDDEHWLPCCLIARKIQKRWPRGWFWSGPTAR